MRKIALIHGSSAFGLAAALAKQPSEQAAAPTISGRHRGREFRLTAPSLGKTERA